MVWLAEQHAQAKELPITNGAGDVEVVLREIDAEAEAAVMELSPADWRFVEGEISDEEGNRYGWAQASGPRDGVFRIQFKGSLGTNRNWKVKTKFVGEREFPRASQGNYSEQERFTVKLSAAGPEVTVTNGLGEAYICRFQGADLLVRRKEGLDRPYLVVLNARNDLGETVSFQCGSCWQGGPGQRPQQMWCLPKAKENMVTVEFGCPRIVETEFIARVEN